METQDLNYKLFEQKKKRKNLLNSIYFNVLSTSHWCTWKLDVIFFSHGSIMLFSNFICLQQKEFANCHMSWFSVFNEIVLKHIIFTFVFYFVICFIKLLFHMTFIRLIYLWRYNKLLKWLLVIFFLSLQAWNQSYN